MVDMKIIIDGKVIAETGDVESIEFVTAGITPEPAPEPEPTPDPVPAPEPKPEPHPDPTQVVTGYHITTWPSESGREIRIPQGKTLASRFVTGEGNHGQFSFEAAAGQYHATDVWISRTPGGNPIDDPRASQQGVSFIYSLRWAEFDNNYRASLQPHTTYYINLRHVDPQASTSTVYRYIK